MVSKPDVRIPSEHRALAREQVSTPPDAWWARPNLTWEQWSALAREADRRMNAVTSTQHVNKTEGFQ